MTNAYARLGHMFLGWFLPRNKARCVHVRIVYIHTHLTLRCIVLLWMALHYVTSSKIKLGSSSPYQVWRVWKMKSSWNTQLLILVISSFHGVIVFIFPFLKCLKSPTRSSTQLYSLPHWCLLDQHVTHKTPPLSGQDAVNNRQPLTSAKSSASTTSKSSASARWAASSSTEPA